MNTQELNEYYITCLENLVGRSDTYDHLLRGLYAREFYSPLELDSSRASWGLWLRRRYMSPDDAASLGPCTVLEVMITLAEQIDDHSEMSPSECIRRYFWMLVENLDMLGLLDFAWGPGMERELNNKIDILLDRRYGDDGVGSLFPLQQYPIDPMVFSSRDRSEMRERDIWAQRRLFDVSAWERWKGII